MESVHQIHEEFIQFESHFNLSNLQVYPEIDSSLANEDTSTEASPNQVILYYFLQCDFLNNFHYLSIVVTLICFTNIKIK